MMSACSTSLFSLDMPMHRRAENNSPPPFQTKKKFTFLLLKRPTGHRSPGNLGESSTKSSYFRFTELLVGFRQVTMPVLTNKPQNTYLLKDFQMLLLLTETYPEPRENERVL